MLSSTYLYLLALVPAALARVVSLQAPSSAAAGTNITAVLSTESYIQNWQDYGAIFGLKYPNLDNCEACVGQQILYVNLYDAINGTRGNTTISLPIPSGQPAGQYTLVAAIPYLGGASGGTGIRYFNQSITVTNTNSA